MDSFCGSPFWDLNVTWHTENPDVTFCFQKTVLVWAPCALLWLFSPVEFYYAYRSKNKNIPWTWLNVSKYVLKLIIMVVALVDLAHTFDLDMSGEQVFPADYFAPAIRLFTFGYSMVLLNLNLRRGIRTSGLQFIFCLLLLVCESFQFRSRIVNSSHDDSAGRRMSFILFVIYFPLIGCLLLLNSFADSPPKKLFYPPPKNPCPEIGASFLSRMLFSWFDRLSWTGFKKPLEFSDLWSVEHEHSAAEVYPIFNQYWSQGLKGSPDSYYSLPRMNDSNSAMKESGSKKSHIGGDPVKKTKVSIVPAICKAFGNSFLFGASLKFLQDVLTFVNPQLLSAVIAHVQSGDNMWKGYLYAVCMFLASILQTIILSQYYHQMYLVGMKIRSALVSAIYRKAMRMSNAARRESTIGEIVNLMSVDAQRFLDVTIHMNMFWSAPLQIGLALYFLWQILGPAVLSGLGVMILLIPLNLYVANQIKNLQISQMKYKDQRVKLMNEVLNGIKVLKLYAWEPSFEHQVLNIRNKELRVLRLSAYLSSGTSFVWSCAPFLVSLASFGTFVLIDENNVLDSQTAFVSLSLFNILRFPLYMLPFMISSLVQVFVSVKRLDKFMNSEEIDSKSVDHDTSEGDPIVVENGSFSWGGTEGVLLKDINFNVAQGELIAVIGSVGSGKSSLLSALLGEMEKISGRVNTKGTVAYVPQQAWIQNALLIDNILFGKEYEKRRYNRVIKTCALEADFNMLPAGDNTEIGEKGINLSGGQKQRISLARAVYCDADIYLLDDPLSAVDSHVGKHIFDGVIGHKGVLRSKTRVLVTHGITFLPQVDKIIVLKDGKINEMGTYKELIKQKGAFAEFLIHHLQEDSTGDPLVEEDLEEIKQDLKETIGETVFKEISSHVLRTSESQSESTIASDIKSSSSSLAEQSSDDGLSLAERREKKLDDIAGERLIEVEKAETGKVKWRVYVHYIRSVGIALSIATLVFSLIHQGFAVGSNFWLAYWSSDASNFIPDRRNMYLGIYGALGLGQAITSFFCDLTPRLGCWNAGRKLHCLLLKGVLRAPMAFFDTTPLGRILARFSKDLDVMDSSLPSVITDIVYCAFEVMATLFVISYSTPMFLTVVGGIGLIYYFVQRFYITTSRQLKRLESISRSPIYSHFGESISGAQSLRAYGVQDRFIHENETRVDKNQMCYYPSIVANRWLAVRLEMVGNLIMFFASLFAIIGRDSLSSGDVGLSISYALQVTEGLNWCVRMASEVETNIVAVERIKEYGETNPEAPWELKSLLPRDWPSKGRVEFRNFEVRYRDGLDLVLKGIDFDVSGGEKVGIVGRTGAGKSSLTLSLFRIIESVGGAILIDGIDIAKLGLHTLRGRLTIIPQDPVLFSGTLRMNLDPFEKHSDAEIWIALEHAHLKVFVKGLPAGLQHEVAEGGENLSVGQRQLICLARALLRKTKVLILDEATAAIDLETDELIQMTIREEFKECTILTIAHRLNTIMDSDRVIVLDKGRIVEFDSPTNLLSRKNSVFYEMAKDAGVV
ncbi:multidrug resistance-associated protein 1-like [Ischnura elegans]|uniref:multidrug resistance-associated protein 1-like n=1 Tax=Ischnura elegans TaxID=197161 RepID=UPI001ED86F0C|nr:multidrug resistance-associated protein 1-like [Ischnura elegans]XP_046388553.1 multidrug resistance-associated protein 1-like [Ischnura elegans]